LQVTQSVSVGLFRPGETRSLAAAIRARDYFAKRRGNEDFYYQRAQELRGATVVEMSIAAPRESVLAVARQKAALVERVVILSAALATNRVALHRALGVRRSGMLDEEFDLVVGPRAEFVRSRKVRLKRGPGLNIDDRLVRRFNRLGFPMLFEVLDSASPFASRLTNGVHWLSESLMDPDLASATVKTSIGLESLLVFSTFEPLAKTLSERSAFLLAEDPMKRRALARVMKRFYDARSQVVHGGARKKKLTPQLLEAADRVSILIMLALAANATVWGSESGFQDWCEDERWSAPSDLRRPFGARHLGSIIATVPPNS
jgi:hypothetical protein